MPQLYIFGQPRHVETPFSKRINSEQSRVEMANKYFRSLSLSLSSGTWPHHHQAVSTPWNIRWPPIIIDFCMCVCDFVAS